uniref:Midnolin-A n=1 Tax=Zeugodacus cucurbitae TaxID=28588 RepID=A0A0A1XFP6_ZEUCU
MKNHGKGIYSGTFSGTLNPALQDRYGRPKRDISTVIHILNDLLSATPQYSRGARISFEAPSGSSAASGASGSSGSAVHGIRSKQLSLKHHYHHHQHSQSCVKCLKSQQNSSSSSSSACTYGECNGHYAGAKAAGATSSRSSHACCKDSANSGSSSSSAANERTVCNCRYRNNTETGEREVEQMCQKCTTDMENTKTKSKIDQLRQVMLQSKQRREARKLKGSPYGARAAGSPAKAATTLASTATAVAAVCANNATNVATATSAMNANAQQSSSSLSTTQQLAAASNSSNNTTAPSEVSPNHIVEEVDTAA